MSDQSDELKRMALEGGIIQQPDLLAEEMGDAERPDIPWIQLPQDGRLVSDFCREAGAAVRNAGIYRYKGRVVTVEINARTQQAEVRDMTPHRLRDWVEKNACFVPYAASWVRKAGEVKIKQTMGVEHAMTCVQSDSFGEQQPLLLRVNRVRLPYRRRDGRTELLPVGYDAESCILTLEPGWEYDEEMKPEEAKHVLLDLVREVPWQDERSRAVFFAAMVSQFAYFLQPLAAKRLNFLFHANSQGTGKTLLAQVALTIAWKVASIDAMPDNAKDLKDRLDTAVREAMPFLVLDDIDRTYLKSATLNSFMTASWWSGRKFHSQEQFTEPKTPVIFMTANNLEVTPDIARRTLVCDLFAPEADLTQRVIERPIDDTWVAEPAVHRQLASALWALVKQWRDGSRQHTGRVVNGYEAWSRIFGALTMSAGFGDPCDLRETDGYISGESADIHALMSALAKDVEKTAEYEFAEILDVCRELNCFPHLIKGKMVKLKGEGADEAYRFEATAETNSSLGLLLGRYGGKSFLVKDGRKIVFDKRGKNRHKKFLIQVAAS